MEKITSRKNRIISHFKKLSADAAYRNDCREFVCDGQKTLKEALEAGMTVKTLLFKDEPFPLPPLHDDCAVFVAPSDLFDYASPLKNCPGPLFTVEMKDAPDGFLSNAIVLENLQDPGNVGTVIRTANAFGIDAVILVGDCADLYNPKTVRATMGAIFRQRVITADREGLISICKASKLSLYGAALTDTARDIRQIELKNAAVAIGSEGRGLSSELLSMCDGELIIPMMPCSESLNAAVAAAVSMWEMTR